MTRAWDKEKIFHLSQFMMTSTLCGSRKYPYPTHGSDFSYDPPPLWIFQKRPTNYTPPPPPEIPIFSYTPGHISISCLKQKIS